MPSSLNDKKWHKEHCVKFYKREFSKSSEREKHLEYIIYKHRRIRKTLDFTMTCSVTCPQHARDGRAVLLIFWRNSFHPEFYSQPNYQSKLEGRKNILRHARGQKTSPWNLSFRKLLERINQEEDLGSRKKNDNR